MCSASHPPFWVMSSDAKHWCWNFFVTDNALYRNNHSNKNAWCFTCLDHECCRHRQTEAVDASLGIGMQPLSDEALEAESEHLKLLSVNNGSYNIDYLQSQKCCKTYGRHTKTEYGSASLQMHFSFPRGQRTCLCSKGCREKQTKSDQPLFSTICTTSDSTLS